MDKDSLSTNDVGTTEQPHAKKKLNLDTDVTPFIKKKKKLKMDHRPKC